ncbi:MAG: DEAD/DEAH box helicase family protein [Lentisphaerota bacterium]
MELRYYQNDACVAVYEHLRTRNDHPCVVIPTGGGKTPVIATLCRDAVLRWHGRVMILAHVKELLEQALDKITVMAPELMNRIGVYSAGLKSKDRDGDIIIAGIQSVYTKACDLGAFDLIIIDEAHLIPPDGEGMYRSFLNDAQVVNPRVKLIGLTATPYRMKSGEICAGDNLLNHICYEIGVKELIAQGFLSPLVSKAARSEVNTDGLHLRGGEFIDAEVESLMDDDSVIRNAVAEILSYANERDSFLLFCSSVQHMTNVAALLRAADPVSRIECVNAKTSDSDRAEYLESFKLKKIKYLLNVNVLTTGFDAPNVDCVPLLRPTNSPGLYYQMVGRGFRLYPGKKNCLVLDFGGNIMRHGPVDMLEAQRRIKGNGGKQGPPPARKCPECLSVIHAAYQICPDCGYEFPKNGIAPHDGRASSAGIISGETSYTEYEVKDVFYSPHFKRGAEPGTPKTMRIEYMTGFNRYISEWVCPEHTGYARNKFVKWWQQCSKAPVPDNVDTALKLIESGAVAAVLKIKVQTVSGEKYDRVASCEFGPVPDYCPEPGWNDCEYATTPNLVIQTPVIVGNNIADWDTDDIPF